MFKTILAILACALAFSVEACDSCGCTIGDPSRGGGSGITAGVGELRRMLKEIGISDTAKTPDATLSNGNVPDLTQPLPEDHAQKLRRWSLDTSFEFRQFQHNTAENYFLITQAGHDVHAYRYDFFITERLGYLINEDLAIGVSTGFRDLHKLQIEDPDRLGQREISTGVTDPVFDVKYRFMRQGECFPLDLAVYGSAKTPFGATKQRQPTGELFETEDQPGSGAWNGTLGLAASHGWEKWGASAAASYTYKAEGSQSFKEGDVTRLSVSASRLLSPDCCAWKLYGSMGLQGILERHAEIHGIPDQDHGGKNMYILPGIAAKPTDQWIVSLSAPIPVIQRQYGSHQKQRFNIQLGVGVRF